MNIKITSDSTCDLSPELIAVNDIGVVALSVEMGGKYYRDGIDITPAVIFEHVDKGGSLCSTSAVNADEYEQYFAPFAETYDAVVHINLGSGFSSCYQNACIAAERFDNVYVIDSQNLSTGQGHVVLEACRAARSCETKEDVERMCEDLRELTTRVEASFLLDRLDYMAKGGRCSSVAALGANLLKLKPCIEVFEGKMRVCKKYRGNYGKCLANYARDRLKDRPDIIRDRLFITYTPVSDQQLQDVVDAVAECEPFAQVYQTHAGCTVSCHCGPGTLGVLFIRKKA